MNLADAFDLDFLASLDPADLLPPIPTPDISDADLEAAIAFDADLEAAARIENVSYGEWIGYAIYTADGILYCETDNYRHAKIIASNLNNGSGEIW